MTWLDRLLQRWRIEMALSYIPPKTRILDIGCGDGALLRAVADRANEAIGIDPDAPSEAVGPNVRFVAGRFPDDIPDLGAFDAITLLATLEHVSQSEQSGVAAACMSLLKPGGVLIATVPSPAVDRITDVLRRLRLIDGLVLHEHYGFDVRTTPQLFSAAGLQPVVHRRFELGLNNLFVFRKP